MSITSILSVLIWLERRSSVMVLTVIELKTWNRMGVLAATELKTLNGMGVHLQKSW